MLSAESKKAIERLTALWALSESGLGGIMHALKIPFTGLIVGGISVIIVSMICVLADLRWKTVFQSLMVVLAIKLAVSPHASFTAYFAVSFQAMAAWIFFRLIPNKTVASFLTAVICMLESALQKLIVLTIFYGKNLWVAVDKLGETAARELGFILKTSSSEVLISGYVLLYAINGMLIGGFMSDLYKKNILHKQIRLPVIMPPDRAMQNPDSSRSRHWSKSLWKPKLLLTLVFVVLVLIYAGNREMSGIGYYIIRVVLIFIFWFGILGPVVKFFLSKYLARKNNGIMTGTERSFEYFPYLKQIIRIAWKDSTGKNLFRIQDFLEKMLLYTLYFDEDEEKDFNPERTD